MRNDVICKVIIQKINIHVCCMIDFLFSTFIVFYINIIILWWIFIIVFLQVTLWQHKLMWFDRTDQSIYRNFTSKWIEIWNIFIVQCDLWNIFEKFEKNEIQFTLLYAIVFEIVSLFQIYMIEFHQKTSTALRKNVCRFFDFINRSRSIKISFLTEFSKLRRNMLQQWIIFGFMNHQNWKLIFVWISNVIQIVLSKISKYFSFDFQFFFCFLINFRNFKSI